MTASNPKKILKQIKNKPAKKEKFSKYNLPRKRKYGRSTKTCRRCGRNRAHISKYGLHYCRQCFREIASKLGFKKYD